MVNQLLVNLVNSVLGSGKQTARNNYAYHCPFCHHHKPKMEVNLTENREGKNPWHCWVCDKKGNTLYQLFRLIKAPIEKISEAKPDIIFHFAAQPLVIESLKKPIDTFNYILRLLTSM